MARRKAKKNNRREKEDLVKIDVYYLPKEQAEMYRVLRDVVKQEVIEWAEEQFETVEVKNDAIEGEGIFAYNKGTNEIFEYYLNPSNISQAQKARDKDQLNTYLSQYHEKESH
ncbi:hypothetical protein HZY86_07465 [Aerococcaceae bacterium DSM 111020]|nr:hypothetical protein [Aerococcaceae bacterium DSM 111020]